MLEPDEFEYLQDAFFDAVMTLLFETFLHTLKNPFSLFG
jgi:hypothetical protein